VVLSRATAWPGHGVSNGARAPLALDLVELMLPSGAIVVPAERMPSPAARAAAFAWQTDRLLVAPALFGHEVLAVGLAALPDGVRADEASVEGAGGRQIGRRRSTQLEGSSGMSSLVPSRMSSLVPHLATLGELFSSAVTTSLGS